MSGGDVTSILVAHQNSHPFMDRECVVPGKENKLKLGRAVAKLKQANDNFIFECKVLSRNHALIWRDGNKFFLQDTKSSNGTYVNNERLSPCNEESEPREIFSGDVLQFGVDVTDNQKKVTHGCIIATLHLVKDGMEMGRPVSTIDRTAAGRMGEGVSSKDCKELLKILSHALHREQEVETKLHNIDRVLVQAHSIVGENLKSRVHEDQLISRIEAMEQQIKMYAHSYSPSDLKTQLADSYRSKFDLENFTKERLQEYHRQLVEGSEKLQETTRDYNKIQDDYNNVRTAYDKLLVEYDATRGINRKQQMEIKDLQERNDQLELNRDQLNLRYQEDSQLLRNNVNELEDEKDNVKQERDAALESIKGLDSEVARQGELVLQQQLELEDQRSELTEKEEQLTLLTNSCSDCKREIEFLIQQHSHVISQLAIATAVLSYTEQSSVSDNEILLAASLQVDSVLVGDNDAVSELRHRLESVQSQLVATERNYKGLVRDLDVANLLRARREKTHQKQQIGLLALAICLLIVIISYLIGAVA